MILLRHDFRGREPRSALVRARSRQVTPRLEVSCSPTGAESWSGVSPTLIQHGARCCTKQEGHAAAATCTCVKTTNLYARRTGGLTQLADEARLSPPRLQGLGRCGLASGARGRRWCSTSATCGGRTSGSGRGGLSTCCDAWTVRGRAGKACAQAHAAPITHQEPPKLPRAFACVHPSNPRPSCCCRRCGCCRRGALHRSRSRAGSCLRSCTRRDKSSGQPALPWCCAVLRCTRVRRSCPPLPPSKALPYGSRSSCGR